MFFRRETRRDFVKTVGAGLAGMACPNGPTIADESSLIDSVHPSVRYDRPSADVANDAWPIWRQAIKRVTESPDELDVSELLESEQVFPGEGERTLALAWMDENKAALELVNRAIEAGPIVFPKIDPDNWDVLDIVALRRISKLLLLHSRRYVEDGEYLNASKTISDVFRTGELIANAQGYLIHCLIGQAVRDDALSQFCFLANQPTCNLETLASMNFTVRRASQPRDVLSRVVIIEFNEYWLPTVTRLFQGVVDLREILKHMHQLEIRFFVNDAQPPNEEEREHAKELERDFAQHPNPFDLPDTVKRTSEHAAKLVTWFSGAHLRGQSTFHWNYNVDPEVFEGLQCALQWNAWDVNGRLSRKRFRELLRPIPNPLGRYLADDWTRSMDGIVSGTVHQAARLEGTKAFLATKLFMRRNGRLPASLDEVVQDGLLDEVPFDPYGEKPVSYSAESRTVHCEYLSSQRFEKEDTFSKESAEREQAKRFTWHLGKPS